MRENKRERNINLKSVQISLIFAYFHFFSATGTIRPMKLKKNPIHNYAVIE